MLTTLLAARAADGRVVALQHLGEQDLSAQQLRECLLDRSARVREMAQWRARRREVDLGEVYRSALKVEPRRTAVAIAGLAAFGAATDVSHLVPYLQDARPAVRAATVAALAARVPAADARRLLPRALLDVSPRVASAAARALERSEGPSEAAEPAWRSEQAWSRKAAWRLQRSGGGWERVEADLRASNDVDARLSSTGQAGLNNWLVNGAATVWNQPTAQQKAMFQQLLPSSGLSRDAQRVFAFHAGLPPQPEPTAADPTRSAATPRTRLSLRQRITQAWAAR